MLNYNAIVKLVKENSKILDLGCGSGALFKMLVDKMNGNIYINSANNANPYCEFVVELPVFTLEEFTKTKHEGIYV